MRFSTIKILLIIFFAVVAALIYNYLRSDSLPLFNETKPSLADENLDSQSSAIFNSEENPVNSLEKNNNKTVPENNKVRSNEDLHREFRNKRDADLRKNDGAVLTDNAGKKTNDVNLSNLTSKVFKPRPISLAQAYELYRNKILFVDARDSTEYNDGHITGAINLPYFFLNEYSRRLNAIDKTKPLVTYCEGADCDMGARLGDELFSKGFRQVFVFVGGWEEWKKAGYPVIKSDTNLNLN